MIMNSEDARSELDRMGLPPIFERIIRRDIPIALAGTCEPVRRYYDLLPQLATILPSCNNYVPLWESNLEEVVAYDSIRDSYVRYFYGNESDEILGATYQQFLSAILLELVDSGIWDELDDLAMLFDYRHVDKLRTFVQACGDDDYEHLSKEFVSSIPD